MGVLTTGCTLLSPGKKEFFQKEVPVFPQYSAKHDEKLRQAASRSAELSKTTWQAALVEGSSDAVVRPAADAAVLSGSVADSLGPPLAQPSKIITAEELAEALRREDAKYRAELQKFEKRLLPLAGKDVEGTGLFQVNYFVWIGAIAVLGFIAFSVLKVVLTLASASNPVFGVGAGALNATGKMAGKAVSELVKGGQFFKQLVSDRLEPAIAEKVTEIFREAHERKQSDDVQTFVKAIKTKV